MRILLIVFMGMSVLACVKYRPGAESSAFPPAVQIIFTNQCATAGCHNTKSAANAGGLDLSSWESLFRGTDNGACVIPFSPSQSSLMQFVNTYADLGLTHTPSMPLNLPALSRNQVLAIRQWIESGCPNARGEIPFASQPAMRPKAYLTNQGCDIVAVIDLATGLVMRYVKVGHENGFIELPHNIKVSPDGKYWYVCFANGSYLQQYDATADTLVKEVNITAGAWNVIRLSDDGKRAFVSDLSSNGRLAEVNLQTMSLKQMWSSGLFSNPHGMAYSLTGDTVFVTAQYGNMVYRIIPSIPQVDQLSLQADTAPVLTAKLLDPHEILRSPDGSKYFITCQSSNELRVLDAAADTVTHIIPLGKYPLEMTLSLKHHCLYITCQEDDNTLYPFFKGSIYVVDINSLSVIHKIYETFYQPHGIAVDEDRDLLYVSSRNVNPSGPAPHHISECGGRNGYFHVIDCNTWLTVIRNAEVSVDPYSMDIRK